VLELSRITSLDDGFKLVILIYTQCKFVRCSSNVLPTNLFHPDFCRYVQFGGVMYLLAK